MVSREEITASLAPAVVGAAVEAGEGAGAETRDEVVGFEVAGAGVDGLEVAGLGAMSEEEGADVGARADS